MYYDYEHDNSDTQQIDCDYLPLKSHHEHITGCCDTCHTTNPYACEACGGMSILERMEKEHAV